MIPLVLQNWSAVNQFFQYDFLRPALDAVHLLHPKHLILCFELFVYSFFLRHLGCQDFHPLSCLFLNLEKMCFQRSFQKHCCSRPIVSLPQKFVPQKSVFRYHSLRFRQLAGYMILIYVAGFMGLSEDVLEAASIDGASGWVKMKNIILPLMMSSVTICLFLTLSRAFMVYDVNLSLTGGAPYGTTEMAAMHVYEKAFTSRQFGVGQAEAFILFIIVACISGIQVYTTKKREVEA